ncbi:MAG: response regulator [Proteobacteria bacterium]|nr:MAG: response regulator [Pseudomonadota bacterium]
MTNHRIPKIICVDDDNDLLNTVADILERKFEAAITRANSVREALEKLDSEGPFDIVVSDFQMPPENGDYLHRTLRARGHEALFVLYSSYDGVKPADFEDEFFLGHIQKPEAKSLIALVGKGLALVGKK